MKSYQLQPTRNPKLYRVVDREKNWEHYAFITKFKESYDPEKGSPTFDDIETVVWLRGSTTILGIGYAKDKFFFDWLSKHTKEEREGILRAAGDRGDMVHRFIDMALNFKPGKSKPGQPVTSIWERDIEIHNRETGEERKLTNDEWDCVLAWGAFWAAHAPQLLFSEESMYNLSVGYAGTADAGLVLTKTCGYKSCPCPELIGKPGLWDWKTSGAIYPSYAPQTASYAFADNLPLLLPKGAKLAYTAILRIGTAHKNGGYQIEASVGEENMEYDMNRFKASKLIADHEYKPFDPTKDVTDIADKFEIVVAPYAPPIIEVPAKKFTAKDAKKIKPGEVVVDKKKTPSKKKVAKRASPEQQTLLG